MMQLLDTDPPFAGAAKPLAEGVPDEQPQSPDVFQGSDQEFDQSASPAAALGIGEAMTWKPAVV
jgi:hypothetical protein